MKCGKTFGLHVASIKFKVSLSRRRRRRRRLNAVHLFAERQKCVVNVDGLQKFIDIRVQTSGRQKIRYFSVHIVGFKFGLQQIVDTSAVFDAIEHVQRTGRIVQTHFKVTVAKDVFAVVEHLMGIGRME